MYILNYYITIASLLTCTCSNEGFNKTNICSNIALTLAYIPSYVESFLDFLIFDSFITTAMIEVEQKNLLLSFMP